MVFGGRQAELAALGYDGRGVNIAIVDSGVDGLHNDLADHMVANHKVLEAGGVATVQSCPPVPANCDWDDNGHGSHVAGIAAGDGTESAGFYTGIAPAPGWSATRSASARASCSPSWPTTTSSPTPSSA